MTELATLARPYAEAAFKRAKQTETASAWSESLLFLSVVAQDRDLIAIISNPKISKDKKIEVVLDICQDQIQDEAKNLLKLLIENGKLQVTGELENSSQKLNFEFFQNKLYIYRHGYIQSRAELDSMFALSDRLCDKIEPVLDHMKVQIK